MSNIPSNLNKSFLILPAMCKKIISIIIILTFLVENTGFCYLSPTMQQNKYALRPIATEHLDKNAAPSISFFRRLAGPLFKLFSRRYLQDAQGKSSPGVVDEDTLIDFSMPESLSYLRRIYGKKEVFKVRTESEFINLFYAVRKIISEDPFLQSRFEEKKQYYGTSNEESAMRAKGLYERYRKLWIDREGKGNTISLYILLIIENALYDNDTQVDFMTDFYNKHKMPKDEFFTLLDMYIDLDLELVINNLPEEVSLLKRPPKARSPEDTFKPITQRRCIEKELITLEDRKLTLYKIKKQLAKNTGRVIVKTILQAMHKAGYARAEKKRCLLFILALNRNKILSLSDYDWENNTIKWRWLKPLCVLIATFKGKRLEEVFDLYYTISLAGNNASDILEALPFAYKRLQDEYTYNKALKEAYRLARLGINPFYFLKNFIPYVGRYFKDNELENVIGLYEDAVLSYMKFRDNHMYRLLGPSEIRTDIHAIKRDREGKLVGDEKTRIYEHDYLVDLVDKEDFIYSLELAQEMAGFFSIYGALLPSLTTLAAKVGREHYRETVEWLVDFVTSAESREGGRPIWANIDTFIKYTVPEIASRLNPANFKDNILRIFRLLKKMKEKGISTYQYQNSFTYAGCKIYKNDKYFNLLMGLAEDLVRNNRNPGPFLECGVERCLNQIERANEEDAEKIIRLLYEIAKRADPKKIYTYSTRPHDDFKGTLDQHIFYGLPYITGQFKDREEKIALIDAEELMVVLNAVINWIDCDIPLVEILDRLRNALPIAYKNFPKNDPKIGVILASKHDETSQKFLIEIVKDGSAPVEFRQQVLNMIGNVKTLTTLAYNASIPMSLRLHATRLAANILMRFEFENFSFPKIDIDESPPNEIPSIKWEEFLNESGIDRNTKPTLIDRTITLDTVGGEMLRVKSAENRFNSLLMLYREAQWLERLLVDGKSFGLMSKLPIPVKIGGSCVFKLLDVPTETPEKTWFGDYGSIVEELSTKEFYINDPDNVPHEEFITALRTISYDLGRLASFGIFHTSLIPMFHNRESERPYEWWQRGRLDRWLPSCDFPNAGTLGMRDLEHLTQFVNIAFVEFMHNIGTEFLSLSLITGSYFRNKDRKRVGRDERYRPYDTRDLFDKGLLKKAIITIFSSYYEGLTGNKLAILPIDVDNLCDRIIDEMGVDRHMHNIDEPDLGEFGGGFSIQELIDAIELMSILSAIELYNKLVEENRTLPSAEDIKKEHAITVTIETAA